MRLVIPKRYGHISYNQQGNAHGSVSGESRSNTRMESQTKCTTFYILVKRAQFYQADNYYIVYATAFKL